MHKLGQRMLSVFFYEGKSYVIGRQEVTTDSVTKVVVCGV